MAYLVGMLANTIPVPGGFFAVEGGLVGMLLLFGARPASLVVAAVVVYRAISLWVPALIGSVAFLGLRREIGKPAAPRRRLLALELFGEGQAFSVALAGRRAEMSITSASRPVTAPARPGQKTGGGSGPEDEPGALIGASRRVAASAWANVSEKTSMAVRPV